MELYVIVAGFIIFDIVTGCIKASYSGSFNSTIMRQGGYHKLSEIVAVIGSALLEHACKIVNLGIDIPLLNVVSVYICATELISIIENLSVVNPSLEKLFKPYLQKLKDKTNNE